MAETVVRCTVTGKVQGVCYRAATREHALALGLTGWVRNLPGGQVELVVAGAAEPVRTLLAWLWQGPPAARVTAVTVDDCSESPGPGFEIRP